MLFFRLTHSRFFCCKKSTNGSNEKFLFLERPVRKKCGQGTVLARFNAKTKPRTPIKFYKKKVQFEKVKKKNARRSFFSEKTNAFFLRFLEGRAQKRTLAELALIKYYIRAKSVLFSFFVLYNNFLLKNHENRAHFLNEKCHFRFFCSLIFHHHY